MWSRIHLIPVLQAEEDRDQVRRYLADQAREKELLGGNTKVYNSDKYVLRQHDRLALTSTGSFDRHTLQHHETSQGDAVIVQPVRNSIHNVHTSMISTALSCLPVELWIACFSEVLPCVRCSSLTDHRDQSHSISGLRRMSIRYIMTRNSRTRLMACTPA